MKVPVGPDGQASGRGKSRGLAWWLVLLLSPAVRVFCGEAAVAAPARTPLVDLSRYVPSWARKELLGIAVWQFASAFALILLGLVLKRISDFLFERKVVPALETTRFSFDNLVARAAGKPFGYLMLLGGLAGALTVMSLPVEPDVRGFAFGVLKVLFAAELVWFLFRAVDVFVLYLTKMAERTDSKLDDQLVPLLRKALKVTLSIIGFIWIIQLLGYSASSLIAGLGIGGLAVALALQDTLANFFGSVFIFLDRPFSVGDWIKVNDVEGVVEEIGFRSTRIRTWPATLVSIPNKTVAAGTIDNWSKMPKRRVCQTIGVTYESKPEQMGKAVAAIRGILEGDDGVDKEFMLVRFTDFGASSLNIMVYYFTVAVGWDDHLTVKERVNLAIMRALEELGLSIAFPTQTVYLEGEVARNMVERNHVGQQFPAGKEGTTE